MIFSNLASHVNFGFHLKKKQSYIMTILSLIILFFTILLMIKRVKIKLVLYVSNIKKNKILSDLYGVLSANLFF
jgi:tellurite resistance protein TehA-like permease